MMYDNINLTVEDILNQDFKIDTSGYRPEEVDKFLDLIIKDYVQYLNNIKKLEQEITMLTNENNHLRTEFRKLKSNIEAAESISNRNGQVNNIDLLRRISQLERIVYSKEN